VLRRAHVPVSLAARRAKGKPGRLKLFTVPSSSGNRVGVIIPGMRGVP
jgi:hypothetical protein